MFSSKPVLAAVEIQVDSQVHDQGDSKYMYFHLRKRTGSVYTAKTKHIERISRIYI